jgi:hypothetical protein
MELHNNTNTTQKHASDLQQLTAPSVNASITGEELEALKGRGISPSADAAFEVLLSKLSSHDVYLRHEAAHQVHERDLGAFNIYQLHALTEVFVKTGDTVNIENILTELGTRAAYDYQRFFDLFQGEAIHLAKSLVEFDLYSIKQHTIREQCINALLREEIASLDISLQRQLLAQPNDTKSLLQVLRYLPDEEAAILLEDIHMLASSNNAVQEELLELWDNAILNSSEEARIEFCRRLLVMRQGDIEGTLSSLLESSEDLETLVRITRTIGIENLPRGERVSELYAVAELYPALRRTLTLRPLECGSSISEIEASIAELHSVYRTVLERHSEDTQYGTTTTARDIRMMAEQSLSVLNKRRTLLDQQVSAAQERSADGAFPEALAQELLLDYCNTHLKIAELQLSFGVSIGYGVASQFDFWVDPDALTVLNWTLEELQSLETSLNSIPEGHLIFSPLLFEIQKVKYIGPGVLAARYSDGVIRVAQFAGASEELTKHYPNIDPLSFVLTHEIGHSLQIGRGYLNYQTLDPNVIDDGEQRYSFDDFVQLSGWEVVMPERWELISSRRDPEGARVKLDGQIYRIGEPIEHNGQKIMLALDDETILLACSSESEFASRWYAKASPWEDFAEAFAEYIHCPERLIEHAPSKFLFIEEEFRKYEDNLTLLELAKKRVRESTLPQ